MFNTKQRVEKALKRLRGKDLSMFGVRMESELKFMKETGINDKKSLRRYEKAIKEHYK